MSARRRIHCRILCRIPAAVLLAAAAAALLAGSATAQGRPSAEDRLRGRLDAATQADVLALVDSARAVGLPTEPLVDKALEGASKRAPGPRIVAAVRTLSAELGGARAVLGGDAPAAEIAAAAGALHIGVRPGEIARLRSARSRQPLTVALGVLSDLVARGVPTDTATMAVTVLVDARVADDELVDFRRSVERDISLGAPPAAAAAGRLTSERFNVGGDSPLAAGGSPPPSPRPPRRP
jgi:hypothetical protein